MFRSKFPRKINIWNGTCLNKPADPSLPRAIPKYVHGFIERALRFPNKAVRSLNFMLPTSPITTHPSPQIGIKEKMRERGRINTTEAFIAVTRYIRV